MKTLTHGGRGVTLIDLEQGETLLAAQPIGPKGVVVAGIGRGAKAQEILLSASSLLYHTGKRARKGKALITKMKAERMTAVE
jgi:topoisomerase-4 subunit A